MTPTQQSLFYLLILGAVLAGLVAFGRRAAAMRRGAGKQVCTQCGFVGEPTMRRPGSTVITFILVWFVIIPAVIYSAWRTSNAFPECPSCKAQRSMVPVNSPKGRELVAR